MPKRIIIFIIIAVTLLSTVSCENNLYYPDTGIKNNKTDVEFEYTPSDDRPLTYNVISGGSMQYYDGCIYFYNGSGDIHNYNSSALMRYNTTTGNLTSVCGDPLCPHNTPECPFYGITDNFHIYGNKIFYRRIYSYSLLVNGVNSGSEEFSGLVSYDMAASHLTVHKTYYNLTRSRDDASPLEGYTEYLNELYTGNYRYYYEYVYDEGTEDYIFELCRMNIDTGETVIYGGGDNIDNVNTTFLFVLDERIYFSDGVSIYSTDLDINDKTEIARGNFDKYTVTDGSYIYYSEKIDNAGEGYTQSAYVYKIHRMNFDGTGDIALGITTNNFVLTSKYIYYAAYDEVTIGKNNVQGYSGKNIVLTGSEIRRCAHDGSGNELVYKFEGDTVNYRYIELHVIGNYIYGTYNYWTDSDGDGTFTEGDQYQSYVAEHYNLMRINITTGEIYYIKAAVK